jgi:hypothetical protein
MGRHWQEATPCGLLRSPAASCGPLQEATPCAFKPPRLLAKAGRRLPQHSEVPSGAGVAFPSASAFPSLPLPSLQQQPYAARLRCGSSVDPLLPLNVQYG